MQSGQIISFPCPACEATAIDRAPERGRMVECPFCRYRTRRPEAKPFTRRDWDASRDPRTLREVWRAAGKEFTRRKARLIACGVARIGFDWCRNASLGNLAEEVRRVLPTIRAALDGAALHDGDDGVRSEAAHALLRAGPQPATEAGALVNALHSELEVVRFHAATALGTLGSDGRSAVPTLIHASLWDEEPAVRVAAAVALRKIDDHNNSLVVRVLTEALDDVNELVCWVAAEYLGQMGAAAWEAIPSLRRALQREFRLTLIKTGVQLAIERIDTQTRAE